LENRSAGILHAMPDVKGIVLLAPLALLVLAASACGGSGHHAAAGPPLQIVQVTEREFSIMPSTISLAKPGTYSFQVTNQGMITHAFEIKGHGIDVKTPHISHGASATLTVHLAAKGSYQAYCPIDGHRSKGMLATVTVGAIGPSVGTTTINTTTTAPTSTAPTTGTTSTKPGY
jgi:uncharacterized cupredoxin-like copper-binding protein